MPVTEIAPDVFRISTFIPEIDMQFNQFLVRDDEPLLFHTGMRALFPLVREAVSTLVDPATLRWISFSHFEADECGSLNEWLEVAPNARPACSFVGAVVSVNDVASRPALEMTADTVLETGRHRFRYLHTPHVPHCWEAGHLFDETERVLFCSDLFHQLGDVEPITESDVVDRARRTLVAYQDSPFANYLPYTKETEGRIEQLAALQPRVLATMHGSAYAGDGARALRDYGAMLRETIG